MKLKRIIDVLASLAAILLLIPLFPLVGLCIKLDSKGPVLFKQERVGQFGKLFNIVKFRTMVHGSVVEGNSITARGDSRITRTGKLLRKFKIDEIPQFWNVLMGEMSLVGPRPEVPKYVSLFRDEFEEILSVRPGITDYASIHYRNEEAILASYDDAERGYIEDVLPAKMRLSREYIRNRNLWIDAAVILKTLCAIVR